MNITPACAVCGTGRSDWMCGTCMRSYRRYAFNFGAVIDAIAWAARRSRRATVERERRRTRLDRAGLLRTNNVAR